ncbi:MAG: FtsW/RodA/SpoVE family cell cycle protein [Eubacteriales bacterium]
MKGTWGRFLYNAQTFFKKADLLLLGLCIFATLFGILVISSTTAYLGASRYVLIQSAALVIGVFLYILFSFLDVDIIAQRRELLLLFNVAFISTLFLWGVAGTTGNRSWLAFTWLPFNIQPAEICKVPYILILAKTIIAQQNKLSSPLSVTKLVLILAVHVGVIMASSYDAGVALIFVFIFIVMVYVAGVKWPWFVAGVTAVVVATPYVWTNFVRDDQQQRIMMIFDPTIDPEGMGVRWHTMRSLTSLQGGGMLGQGLYSGTQTQAGALTSQHNDFIFSAIGEEMGVVGCIFVLVLLTAIVYRCIYIGYKSGNKMNLLICAGIAGMMIFQIAVNVGMCMGLFPVIGLTLPFISYGGSSIVTTFAAMGIVSGVRMRPAPDTEARYIHPSHNRS